MLDKGEPHTATGAAHRVCCYQRGAGVANWPRQSKGPLAALDRGKLTRGDRSNRPGIRVQYHASRTGRAPLVDKPTSRRFGPDFSWSFIRLAPGKSAISRRFFEMAKPSPASTGVVVSSSSCPIMEGQLPYAKYCAHQALQV